MEIWKEKQASDLSGRLDGIMRITLVLAHWSLKINQPNSNDNFYHSNHLLLIRDLHHPMKILSINNTINNKTHTNNTVNKITTIPIIIRSRCIGLNLTT